MRFSIPAFEPRPSRTPPLEGFRGASGRASMSF